MNPTLAAIPGSLIRQLNAAKQPGDIDLGLGEPTLKPDSAPFEAALAWVKAHGCPYTANAGDPALRLAIASHYAYPGLHQATNVCVTVGSQEALYLAIKAVCDPAVDEVLIVTPAYPAYAKICALEGLRVLEVSLDPATGFSPDAARVLAAITPRTRLVLLATPSNPTGRVWPDAELAALATGLAGLGDSRPYVLVDEVYRELVYVNPAPQPFARHYDRTLVVNSLSKSHALTGLRLGWLLAPHAVLEAATKAHQFVATAASTFSQQVAAAIFTPGADMAIARPHYEAQRKVLGESVARLGLTHIAPDGAFYSMVQLPPGLAGDSLSAAKAILASHHVVTIPGVAFAAEGWLRVSWVAAPDELTEGLSRLAHGLAAHSQ